jgi:hypothetical protein
MRKKGGSMAEKSEETKTKVPDALGEKMCEKFEALFQKHFHNSPDFSQNIFIVNKLQAFKSEYLATLREK